MINELKREFFARNNFKEELSSLKKELEAISDNLYSLIDDCNYNDKYNLTGELDNVITNMEQVIEED